ncbi:MAG: hypothetical protein KDE28_01495, partial [Anaerolineales bacterium]|nr:hypothetical protein [Anaerolineales bacterium]
MAVKLSDRRSKGFLNLMAIIVSGLTTLVSFILALKVGRQYQRRGHPHQLVWAIALLFFALGVGCQFLGEFQGWSPLLYRLWYLTGAILTAAYLGLGTVYLQAKRPTAHRLLILVIAASVVAALMVWQAPIDLSQAYLGHTISGQGMPRSVRLLTPFF